MNAQVKEWCRQQCIRQHATTDADFAGMEKAWEYVSMWAPKGGIAVDDLKELALMIDPVANPGGRFRSGPAVFMDGGSAIVAQHIAFALDHWFEDLAVMTIDEAYRQLMYIHPFKDGNGRVGALVYNWLNGTIAHPVDPPEYK